jgi:peptidyl-prolyl cis-trans isomerase B (cyclophilin B)
MANIQELARQGFYNGTKFHYVGTEQDRRTATALMGGDPNTISDPESSGTWGQGKPGQKTVPLEQSTYKFERGTFAAFRKSDDPNSASSQFLICIKANPQWNEQTRGLSQYSILGRVVEGMNVVDTIVRAMVERRIPANAGPDTDPRFVTRIYLVSRDDYKKQGNQSAMATGETLP